MLLCRFGYALILVILPLWFPSSVCAAINPSHLTLLLVVGGGGDVAGLWAKEIKCGEITISPSQSTTDATITQQF